MDSMYKIGQKVIVDEIIVSEIQAVYKTDESPVSYYYSVGGVAVRQAASLKLITETEEKKV